MEETGVPGENNWLDDMQRTVSSFLFFFCRFIPKLSLVALNVWRITEFKIRITQRVSLVGQELLSFPRHQTLTSAFTGGLVAQSSFLCTGTPFFSETPDFNIGFHWRSCCSIKFSMQCCNSLSFSFSHYFVCPSYNVPLWYVQTFFFCNCSLVLQLYYLLMTPLVSSHCCCIKCTLIILHV